MKLYRKTCLICGMEFRSTGNNAKYCSDDCRKTAGDMEEKKQDVNRRPYYPWNGYKDIQEFCEGCIHFRSVCGTYMACHYMLDRNERREKAKDGSCLSKDTNKDHIRHIPPEEEWPERE